MTVRRRSWQRRLCKYRQLTRKWRIAVCKVCGSIYRIHNPKVLRLWIPPDTPLLPQDSMARKRPAHNLCHDLWLQLWFMGCLCDPLCVWHAASSRTFGAETCALGWNWRGNITKPFQFYDSTHLIKSLLRHRQFRQVTVMQRDEINYGLQLSAAQDTAELDDNFFMFYMRSLAA